MQTPNGFAAQATLRITATTISDRLAQETREATLTGELQPRVRLAWMGSRWSVGVASAVIGMMVFAAWANVVDKAQMFEGPGLVEQITHLQHALRQTGTYQLRSCATKVDDLHNSLDAPRAASAGRFVTSILIDGKNCNESIVRYVDSRAPLGDISIYRGFRGSAGGHLSSLVNDEQALMLWILDRINPEHMGGSLADCLECGIDEDTHRSELVAYWKIQIDGD